MHIASRFFMNNVRQDQMPTYAVGDIQGCYDEFAALLDLLDFQPERDRLWLVGDLINRGPRSLQVVRKVRELGDAAVTVLGNHELHLLAVRYGGHPVKAGDTFGDLLSVPDADELCEWLRSLPLLVHDGELGYVMVHAGIPHIWSLQDAQARAREVEAVIRGGEHREYFAGIYGDEPACWSNELRGLARWRIITNYFTRMRLIDADGCLDLKHKGALDDAPEGWHPWYRLRRENPLGARLVFGHWAALAGKTGVEDVVGLDTGCVWGGTLTAMCLETGELSSIPAT